MLSLRAIDNLRVGIRDLNGEAARIGTFLEVLKVKVDISGMLTIRSGGFASFRCGTCCSTRGFTCCSSCRNKSGVESTIWSATNCSIGISRSDCVVLSEEVELNRVTNCSLNGSRSEGQGVARTDSNLMYCCKGSWKEA